MPGYEGREKALSGWLTSAMANRNYKNAYWGSINYMHHMRAYEQMNGPGL